MTGTRHAILCVDDEKNVLNALRRLLRKEAYVVLTASNGESGLDIMKENIIHLVICDQRMPKMSGTEFLALVKESYPDVIWIMLTGYTEVDTITESVNKGHIYKFFLKPWNDHNLKLEIRQALEHYDLILANRELHDKVIDQNRALKLVNENLEDLVSQRTEELEFKNQALELSRTILEELYFPIVGISREGLVVMVNKAADRVLRVSAGLVLGQQAQNIFPSETMAMVMQALANNSLETGVATLPNGVKFNFQCNALSGKFKGKGVVLSLKELPG